MNACDGEKQPCSNLMARMLQELHDINKAQHLEDALKQELQLRRKDAEAQWMRDQDLLKNMKARLSQLYEKEAERQILCEQEFMSKPGFSVERKSQLTRQHCERKRKVVAAQAASVASCIEKIKEHDRVISKQKTTGSQKNAAEAKIKELEVKLATVSRQIAGVEASKVASSTQILKTTKELDTLIKSHLSRKKELSDLQAECIRWSSQETDKPDILEKVRNETKGCEPGSDEYFRKGILIIQAQDALISAELQTVRQLANEKQAHLKSLLSKNGTGTQSTPDPNMGR